MSVASGIQVHLLGIPQMYDGNVWHDLPLDQSVYLLTVLATRGTWVVREELITLFWPDNPLKTARHNLSQLLYRAKRLVQSTPFESDTRRIRWHGRTDVGRFRDALEQHAWPEALDAYRGPLLEGVQVPDMPEFEMWLEQERRVLQEAWRDAVRCHATALEAQNRFAEAALCVRRALELDLLVENDVALYLRLAGAAGQRNEALSLYSEFERALRHEFGVNPLPATRQLMTAIQQNVTAPLGMRLTRKQPFLNLPEDTGVLIGREIELLELSSILAEPHCRLLTIFGPGGIGKTRLATELAREHGPSCQAGAVFVPLEGVATRETIISQFMQSFGLHVMEGSDGRTQLLNYLRDKSMLVVVDNVEHLLDEVDLLQELLEHAPSLKMIVTSRACLALQEEQIYELGGLGTPDRLDEDDLTSYAAIRLFIHLARQADSQFTLMDAERQQAARICRAVAGSPLGIALAASWVRAAPLSDIANSIDIELAALGAEASEEDTERRFPARHQSLRAVFEYSWTLLGDQERQALRRLSVFASSFGRESAQAVTGTSLSIVLALVNRALVQASRNPSGFFNLHPLIRAFAQEKLADQPDEHQEIHARHADYIQVLLRTLANEVQGIGDAGALVRFGRELPNIRVAWRWIHAERDQDRAAHLWEPLAKLYELQGDLEEGAAFLREFLELSRSEALDVPITLVEAKALAILGWFIGLTGRNDEATRHLMRSLHLFHEARDELGTATCLYYLGELAYRQDDNQKAKRDLREGLRLITDRVGVAQLRARMLNTLGMIAWHQDQLEEARVHCEEALVLLRPSPDRYQLALCLGSLGLISLYRSTPLEARRYLEESLALARDLQIPSVTAKALNNLGNLAYNEGHYGEAWRFFSEALTIFSDTGDLYGTGLAHYNLGRTAYHQKEYAAALEQHQQSLSCWQLLDNEVRIDVSYNHLARIYLRVQDADTVKRFCRLALAGTLERDDQAKAMNAFTILGLLFWHEGSGSKAISCLACALKYFRAGVTRPDAASNFFEELLELCPAELMSLAQRHAGPGDWRVFARGLLDGLQR